MEDGGCIEDEWRMDGEWIDKGCIEDEWRMDGEWIEVEWRMEDV